MRIAFRTSSLAQPNSSLDPKFSQPPLAQPSSFPAFPKTASTETVAVSSATHTPLQLRLIRNSSFPLSYFILAVGPSALPCAGAAPPQRPPTKPTLTDRVHSSQPVGWRAWRPLYTSCVTKSQKAPKNDWPVNYCGLVVAQKLETDYQKNCSSAPPQHPPRLATLFTLPQQRV